LKSKPEKGIGAGTSSLNIRVPAIWKSKVKNDPDCQCPDIDIFKDSGSGDGYNT